MGWPKRSVRHAGCPLLAISIRAAILLASARPARGRAGHDRPFFASIAVPSFATKKSLAMGLDFGEVLELLAGDQVRARLYDRLASANSKKKREADETTQQTQQLVVQTPAQSVVGQRTRCRYRLSSTQLFVRGEDPGPGDEELARVRPDDPLRGGGPTGASRSGNEDVWVVPTQHKSQVSTSSTAQHIVPDLWGRVVRVGTSYGS